MPATASNSLLSLGLVAAKAPEAIRQGEADYNAEELRKLNREGAKQRLKMGEYQLAQMGREHDIGVKTHDAKVEQLTQTLTNQEQTLRLQGQKMFREDTYRAIDGIYKEANFNQFNNFLQEATNNPYAPSIMKDTLRIDPINFNSDTDRQALNQAGITNEMLDSLDGKTDSNIDWDLVGRRYVLATNADGSKEVRDVFRLGVVTGYGDWADAQGRAKMKELADIKNKAKDSSGKPSSFQEKSSVEAEYQRLKKAGLPIPEQIRAGHRLFASETGGDVTVRQEHVDEARQEWQTLKFDELSQDKLQSNLGARRIVNTIEKDHGLSADEKKRLIDLSTLVVLSKEAGQLSEEQTGLMDKMLSGASSYVSENVGSKTAKTAYGAFINKFRHELFGSALTSGELSAFKEAYGALGQKTGPVLAGLRAALLQVKSQLETIYNLNDPIVMKFRTGKTMDEVQAAMNGVEQRIKFYDLVSSGVSPDQAAVQVGMSGAKATTEPSKLNPEGKVMSDEDIRAQLYGSGA